MTKRTPTNILALRGSFQHHPERARARASEPKPTEPIGAPSPLLNAPQRECYHELIAKAYPGTLGPADQFVVELAAVLLEQLRRDPAMSAARMARLQSLLASLGMSPADRSRVAAVQQPLAPDDFKFQF